ncbi:MAG TPA: phosphate uptake regulator PhoU [Candidatus Dormibacteraeota bacterium]|nr:phosphate uptake regulator PhoU [Candidatus Dormibacteraeota bacterium]
MPRLMDMGEERLSSAIVDMANLAQDSVVRALEAYEKGQKASDAARKRAAQLSQLSAEVEELGVDLLARYQPVATDLRFIKSCLEIAYGFSRFGRYAYDIAQVLEIYGDLSACDKSVIHELSEKVTGMIERSIQSFKSRDTELARSLRKDDDEVDQVYRKYTAALAKDKTVTVRCALASTLVLRYLERIADHACYIGDSVVYIVTGSKA